MLWTENIKEKAKTIFRVLEIFKKRNDETVRLSANLDGSLGDYMAPRYLVWV